MYKVLIAEDEKLFREYLYAVVDWDQTGFAIVGEACTGIEALEQMEIKRPDVVLVDINMPQMDGLTFIQEAKKQFPDVIYLVITGHSEFEYAQKAIKVGVTDYLLKPFDEDDFVQALQKVKASLQKKEASQEHSCTKNVLLNWYFNEMINGYYKNCKQAVMDFLQDQFGHNDCYFIAVLEKDYLPENWHTLDQKELWKEAVMNIVEELQTQKHYTFVEQNGHIVCFVFEPKQEATIPLFEKIATIVKEMLGFSITVAISDVFHNFDDACYEYSKCIRRLDKKLVLGCGKVLIDENSMDMERCLDIEQYFVDFNRMLSIRKEEDVIITLEKVFEQMKVKKVPMEVVSIVAIDMISDFIKKLNEIGLKMTDVFGQEFMPFSSVKKAVDIEQMKDNVKETVCTGIRYLSSKKFTRAESITKMAKEYIGDHYGEGQLKAEDVADFLHIHCGYLRTVFKKESNITISRYIFIYRMEQAKKFISEGFMKLSEVAYLVGFSDAAYFSKCFKKHFGVSPSEFYNINNKRDGTILK